VRLRWPFVGDSKLVRPRWSHDEAVDGVEQIGRFVDRAAPFFRSPSVAQFIQPLLCLSLPPAVPPPA
jgi:hypothetical protein